MEQSTIDSFKAVHCQRLSNYWALLPCNCKYLLLALNSTLWDYLNRKPMDLAETIAMNNGDAWITFLYKTSQIYTLRLRRWRSGH
jgi:hypothetical protein